MTGSPIPYFTGPQDPSQLQNLLDQLITNINSVLVGTTSVAPVTAQSTLSQIPGYGAVTVNSTIRTSGTTGRYTIGAPVTGRVQIVTSLSTVKATIAGLFSRGRTKITLQCTASLAGGAKLPSVILRGLSTSAWAITASHGNALCT